MAFDQSPITGAAEARDGHQVHLSWTSTAADGSWYQVYVGRRLTWHGRTTSATIPAPQYREQVAIGVVGPTERAVDFSASLPAPPIDRVTLAWRGGTFQGDASTFRIYADGPGTSHKLLGSVPAYTAGIVTDGFGVGGFGDGGFGAAAGSYSWTSGSLANGSWTFTVVAVDSAGNEGSTATQTATIAAPPNPPAVSPTGKRLTLAYDPATFKATLTWLASPE